MTVESNYAIMIATPSDWLKNLAPGFQAMRSNTNHNLYMQLSKLQVIARNSDRFIARLPPDVIRQSNYYFGMGFSTVIGTPLHLKFDVSVNGQ